MLGSQRAFLKAWLLLHLCEEKSCHVVLRGQDFIGHWLYLHTWLCVSDDLATTDPLETQTVFKEENCMVFI